MASLGQNDDFIEGRWREVDSDYRDDFQEGLRFDDIMGFFKSKPKRGKEDEDEKGKKKNIMKPITIIWRVANWNLLYFAIEMPLVNFLMKETKLSWIDMIFYADIRSLILIILFAVAWMFSGPIPLIPKNDPKRISLGCFISFAMSIVLYITLVIGKWGLLWRVMISISILFESIVTDAKGGRIPSKRDVVTVEKTKDGKVKFSKYKE